MLLAGHPLNPTLSQMNEIKSGYNLTFALGFIYITLGVIQVTCQKAFQILWMSRKSVISKINSLHFKDGLLASHICFLH